jgi:magnesium-transporting ATPase (P-type)
MQPRLKSPNNTPRGITVIANLFLCVGCFVFAASILILLLGLLLFFNYANTPDAERLPLFGIASIMLGVPGILLSVMTMVSSVGLRKMRKWGLWCSYCTMAVLTTLYIVIRGNQFAINTPLDLCGHLMALTIVAIEIYLTRIYWQYFTRA